MANIIDVALLTVLSLCAILMGAITISVMIMCYRIAKQEKDLKKNRKGEKEENEEIRRKTSIPERFNH